MHLATLQKEGWQAANPQYAERLDMAIECAIQVCLESTLSVPGEEEALDAVMHCALLYGHHQQLARVIGRGMANSHV